MDYAANQGCDWVVLTNGTVWKVYKIAFSKPIEQLVVQFDLLASRAFADARMGWKRLIPAPMRSTAFLESFGILALLAFTNLNQKRDQSGRGAPPGSPVPCPVSCQCRRAETQHFPESQRSPSLPRHASPLLAKGESGDDRHLAACKATRNTGLSYASSGTGRPIGAES